MVRPPYICSNCGQQAWPVLRLVDGYPCPVARCCSAYLVLLKNAPTPRELLRRKRQRTA